MPGLSDAQRAHFTEHGYIVVDRLFQNDEVAAINANLSRLLQESDAAGRHPAPGVSIQFEAALSASTATVVERELAVRKFFQFGAADRFFWSTVRDRRIVERLDDLLGRGAQLLQSMALVKPPEVGSPKEWHQDIPYFPITPGDECVGVWIATDDATLENGCMQVVSGSHRFGPVDHVQGPTGWRLPDERVAEFADQVVAIPVPAGSALFFSACLFHFTDHNRSSKRRRAVQYHYVSARTRWLENRPGFELADLSGSTPPRLAARC